MKRVLVGLWIVLIAGVAGAAPARLHYEPKKRETLPAYADLRGTTWTGACFDTHCRITFKADGTLDYQSGNGKADGRSFPGLWRVADNLLVFEINSYSDHRGVIVGDTIQGESSNKGGGKGKFRLDRFPSP